MFAVTDAFHRLTQCLGQTRATAAIESDHVVPVLDAGVEGDLPYIVMELLSGEPLAVRMERHSDNAEKVAAYLTEHPGVSEVYYPGLESHAQHDVAKRQMRRFGGMVSFRVRAGEQAAVDACGRTTVFTLAESLGGVESLIEHPGRMTHASVAGTALEVPPDLIRLSVGLEDVEDLLADLDQALR